MTKRQKDKKTKKTKKTKRQKDKKTKNQKDKKSKRQKTRQKDKKTKRQKDRKTERQTDKRQRPQREFDIVTSGQFRTLAMFLFCTFPLSTTTYQYICFKWMNNQHAIFINVIKTMKSSTTKGKFKRMLQMPFLSLPYLLIS